MLLATDGLIEAKDANGRAFGWERLHQALRRGDSRADGTLERILGAVTVFVGTSMRSDDITLVLVGVDEK